MSFALVLALLFTLSSCTSVQIKDQEWCADLGAYGASCVHTITDESRDVQKEPWDIERFGMVCTKAQNFADLKETILKLCHYSRKCVYQAEAKINAFFDRVEKVTQSQKQVE